MKYLQITTSGMAIVFLMSLLASGQEQNLPIPPGMFPLPDNMVVKKMSVTNGDYKLFRPDHKYDPSMEQYPVAVTELEADAYANWAGKKLGKDLVWHRRPPTNKGYIMIVTSPQDVEGLPPESASIPGVPPNMVYVPAGAFTMGSDVGDADEMPKHQAVTEPFFIDIQEVSNSEYRGQFPEFTFPAGQEEFPAIVTWDQASAYAAKVDKRLPTEAEWEKAARSTDGRMFPWGDSFDCSFVVCDEKTPRGGAVARPTSPYGCIDMAGSAWEWTADWYQPYPGNTSPSTAYGEKFKVIRGGGTFNDISMYRCAHRYYLFPNTTGKLRVGFRCVKDVK